MLNGCFHRRQSPVIGEFPFTVFAPVTLNAVESAELNYIWRLAVLTGCIIHDAYLFGYVEHRIGYTVLFLTHLREHHLPCPQVIL
jgi:hypothetical protein